VATISEAVAIALQHHGAGRLQTAEEIYRKILAAQPNQPTALYLLGVLALQVGRYDVAIENMGRAIRLQGDDAAWHYNLGEAYRAGQQLPEAIACFRQALQLQPSLAEAHFSLGNALKALGQLAEAAACYRRALQARPDHAEAYYNLGNTLTSQGELAEAILCYRHALQLKPDHALAHNNLGNVLMDQGQLAEAVACYQRALQLRPDYAEAHCNLGGALRQEDRTDEAIEALRKALSLHPDLVVAYSHLAAAHKDRGELDEALACCERALALQSDNPALDSNRVYALLFHPGHDASAILQEHRRWAERHARPLLHRAAPHENDPSPDRRLRIGYVSPDFRDHVVGRNVLPLLRQHDHAGFEVFCYADVARPDPLSDLFRSCADCWRDVRGHSDEQLAGLVRRDRIDLLIDLTLHMSHNRLLVFARKPAPVQVTFAGYPGTTGLEAIDYRLTDPYLDPPGLSDAAYVEQSVRLPQSFWCYDPLTGEPGVAPLPASARGFVTFGCLNNFCKVNEAVLRLWARVLRAVPGSRLLLRSPHGSHRRRVGEVLCQEGVGSDRLAYLDRLPREQYLRAFHGIDIGLDTFPYNGHTTSLDSFWMGVPVVTLVGQAAVGRAGFCQLWHLGLPELAAESVEQFVEVAAELARDLRRLAALRSGLRDRMERSPLMDAVGFARGIESVYRELWRRWCHGRG
jgi:predicted O-linked N-acetylglucosamine transferase (SPINDLY family)